MMEVMSWGSGVLHVHVLILIGVVVPLSPTYSMQNPVCLCIVSSWQHGSTPAE
jgi:hypothetical protein